MCEWTNCSTPEELELHLTTQTSLSPHPNIVISSSSSHQPLLPSECTDRFQFKSKEELPKGYMPANSNRSTKWALKVYDLWSQARNQQYPEDPIPEHLLTSCDLVLLNTHLARFTVELGRPVEPYPTHYCPPTTMWTSQIYERKCSNFLDKKDSCFRPLQGT